MGESGLIKVRVSLIFFIDTSLKSPLRGENSNALCCQDVVLHVCEYININIQSQLIYFLVRFKNLKKWHLDQL